MDKLIITPKRAQVNQSNLVRVSDEAMSLVQSLQRETGQSAKYLVEQMIAFAYGHVVVSDTDDED